MGCIMQKNSQYSAWLVNLCSVLESSLVDSLVSMHDVQVFKNYKCYDKTTQMLV